MFAEMSVNALSARKPSTSAGRQDVKITQKAGTYMTMSYVHPAPPVLVAGWAD